MTDQPTDPIAEAIEATEGKPDFATALKRAADKVVAIRNDPVAAAALISKQEDAIKGAYAIVQVLAKRLGADRAAVTVNRQEWQSLPPGEQLDMKLSRDAHVTLRIVSKG